MWYLLTLLKQQQLAEIVVFSASLHQENSKSTNSIMRKLIASIFLLSLFASNTQAQDAFQSDLSQPSLDSDANSVTAVEEEFVPADEAFKLSIDVQPETLTISWDILPKYYLDRDQFRVKGFYLDDNGEGREVPLDLDIDEGIVKYEPLLEKDIEKIYDQANIRMPTPTGMQKLQLEIRSQGCSTILCYPPKIKRIEVDLDRGTYAFIDRLTAKPAAIAGSMTPGGQQAPPFIGLTLLFALLGGLILNAMPCVFPVLSIKALSFVSASGDGHSHRTHGWAYTAGTVTTFMLVGGLVAAMGSTWGSHLSNPYVVGALFLLFLVMGLSLSGFIYFGTSFMGMGQSLTTKKGLKGSFFTGALAVVVATPCTMPFMAAALAVALSQPGPMTLAIFATLGFGMALPFLLLSYSRRFADLLPKPGPWMEVFKQSLSFPMYLTAIWLFSVLVALVTNFPPDTVEYIALLVGAAAFAAFAVWMFSKNPVTNNGKKILGMAVATSAIAAIGITFSAEELSSDEGWQAYSPELVADLRNQGKPVFVNLTAAWCITCHANERVALSRKEVKSVAESLNIAMVKGDYTNEDPRITALLNEYRRVGVPTYLMFPADPNKPAEVLPQILSVDTVVAAMERSAGNSAVAVRN